MTPPRPSSGGFNLLSWVGHEAKAHWQQELELVGLGVCIFASAGLCLLAGGAGTRAAEVNDAFKLSKGLWDTQGISTRFDRTIG